MSESDANIHHGGNASQNTNPKITDKQIMINLTVTLLITSFIMSILSITSSKWVTVQHYAISINEIPVLASPIGTSTRGPFKYCLLVPKNGSSYQSILASDYHRDCSVPKCTSAAPNNDEDFVCQQLRYTRNFLIAGCVFIALGLCMTFPAMPFLMAPSQGKRTGPKKPTIPPYLILPLPNAFYVLALVLGWLLYMLGNFIGANVLVNEQIGVATMGMDHWILERGVWIGFGAWLLALIAVVVVNESSKLEWPHEKEERERLLGGRNEV